MKRRWWSLPVVLTVLVAGACGVKTPTAGADGAATPSAFTPTDQPEPATAPTSLPIGECRGWAISLPSTGAHGADTPDVAANSARFRLPPQYEFPSTSWTTASSLPAMIWLGQQQGTLEISQMPDGSWYVTAGNRCG